MCLRNDNRFQKKAAQFLQNWAATTLVGYEKKN
jgi:hypothetical protein